MVFLAEKASEIHAAAMWKFFGLPIPASNSARTMHTIRQFESRGHHQTMNLSPNAVLKKGKKGSNPTITDKQVDRIKELNAFDMELYEFAQTLHSKSIKILNEIAKTLPQSNPRNYVAPAVHEKHHYKIDGILQRAHNRAAAEHKPKVRKVTRGEHVVVHSGVKEEYMNQGATLIGPSSNGRVTVKMDSGEMVTVNPNDLTVASE